MSGSWSEPPARGTAPSVPATVAVFAAAAVEWAASMSSSSDRPLAAFRQELPYRSLAPLALRFAEREPGTVFLDAQGDPGDEAAGARWAILGWRPKRTFAWPAGRKGAIDGLRAFLGTLRLGPDPDSPAPFRGGFIGWIGYDIGRDIERLPNRNPADPAMPEFVVAEYEALLVEDRRDRRLFLAGTCDRTEGPTRLLARQAVALEAFAEMDREAAAGGGSGATNRATEGATLSSADFVERPAAAGGVRAETAREEYLDRARRVLEYVAAGDIFQANLSHRLSGTLTAPVTETYRRLRDASPAPYGAFLRLRPGPDVLSISPELFLERRGSRVLTRPIKGTRPRGVDPADDARLRAELSESAKDRAELAMIVDLLRNDLGRVARTGTVRVETERELRAHPTVHHAIASVTAEVPPSVHAADVLRATMPGGSVTGAPKIRAMEILEELEDARRGPYSGAAGWFGYDGDFVLNILIRTLVVEGAPAAGDPDFAPGSVGVGAAPPRVSFRVGGGIVADSDPAAEYDETLVKARAMLRALGAESP